MHHAIVGPPPWPRLTGSYHAPHLQELIASDVSVDGVLISTPHRTHFELGMQASPAAGRRQSHWCTTLHTPLVVVY